MAVDLTVIYLPVFRPPYLPVYPLPYGLIESPVVFGWPGPRTMRLTLWGVPF